MTSLATSTNRPAAAAACIWAVHDEFAALRARFHRALAVSVCVHALLAAALVLVEGRALACRRSSR